MKTSARNTFEGVVAQLKSGAVNDEVAIDIGQGTLITAVITKDSTENLGLAVGVKAFALIKASSVILATDLAGVKLSTRNQIVGTVSKLTLGAVNAEVELEVAAGQHVVAIVTNESAQNLGLALGSQATAIVKASQVIVGVKA